MEVATTASAAAKKLQSVEEKLKIVEAESQKANKAIKKMEDDDAKTSASLGEEGRKFASRAKRKTHTDASGACGWPSTDDILSRKKNSIQERQQVELTEGKYYSLLSTYYLLLTN